MVLCIELLGFSCSYIIIITFSLIVLGGQIMVFIEYKVLIGIIVLLCLLVYYMQLYQSLFISASGIDYSINSSYVIIGIISLCYVIVIPLVSIS